MKTNQKTNKKLSLLSLFWKGLGGGLLLFALAGCPGESPIDNPDDPNNPSNPETPVNVVMQNVVLTGTVKDAGGNPLSGVKVTTGSLNATTGSDGKFSFTQAGTVDDRAVIKFEKSGYFSLTRSGDREDEMYMNPMMYRKGNDSITLQTTFDASSAKTLQIGGVKIELPANCMAKADGSAYSGTVHADILYLAVDNPNMRKMMPGGDLATDKKDKMMLPVGTADVVFTDDAGNPLKIKAKTNVPVSYSLPSGKSTDGLPATVPLWTFDEARGVWREEGSATLKGNAYSGTTTHFSPRAPGLKYDFSVIGINAVTCDDKPASPAVITIEHNWDAADALGSLAPDCGFWPSGEFYTLSDGVCYVSAPTNLPVKVTGRYQGQTKIATVITGKNLSSTAVRLEFKDNCGKGVDLVFNLKGGLMTNSVIIECSPAMPEPSLPGLTRYTPDWFILADGNMFFQHQTAGYPPPGGGGFIVQRGAPKWNESYTECTFVFDIPWAGGSFWWTGTVKMTGIADVWLNPDSEAYKSLKYLRINSLRIGNNTPVAVSVGTKP